MDEQHRQADGGDGGVGQCEGGGAAEEVATVERSAEGVGGGHGGASRLADSERSLRGPAHTVRYNSDGCLRVRLQFLNAIRTREPILPGCRR